MSWNRVLWADRSREFLSRTLLRQDEFQQSLLKRAWMEKKVQQFSIAPLFDEAKANGNVELCERLANIRPRVLLYGSSIAGTAFQHGDADFAVVFPIRSALNPTGAPSLEVTDTADNMASIPVGCMGFIGGMATFPRQAQPTVLTALYEHVMRQGPHNSSSQEPLDSAATAPRLQRIFRARIPILQYIPSLAELQERNSGSLDLTGRSPTSSIGASEAATSKKEHYDISLSVDGGRNSLLIRSYMKQYPALRVACLVLKQWGRQKKILNARRGWISPYALTIMLIHYAVEANVISAPIAPDSVDCVLARISQNMCAGGDMGVETSTVMNGEYGVEDMDCILPLDLDDGSAFEGVADIVKGFFEYYGGVDGRFDFDANVVDIRTERRVLSKEDWFSQDESDRLADAEKWHRVGYGVLMIRDPFENHSLGRSVEFFRSESIREEMRVAAKNGVSNLEGLLPLGA